MRLVNIVTLFRKKRERQIIKKYFFEIENLCRNLGILKGAKVYIDMNEFIVRTSRFQIESSLMDYDLDNYMFVNLQKVILNNRSSYCVDKEELPFLEVISNFWKERCEQDSHSGMIWTSSQSVQYSKVDYLFSNSIWENLNSEEKQQTVHYFSEIVHFPLNVFGGTLTEEYSTKLKNFMRALKQYNDFFELNPLIKEKNECYHHKLMYDKNFISNFFYCGETIKVRFEIENEFKNFLVETPTIIGKEEVVVSIESIMELNVILEKISEANKMKMLIDKPMAHYKALTNELFSVCADEISIRSAFSTLEKEYGSWEAVELFSRELLNNIKSNSLSIVKEDFKAVNSTHKIDLFTYYRIQISGKYHHYFGTIYRVDKRSGDFDKFRKFVLYINDDERCKEIECLFSDLMFGGKSNFN